ncbi:MAG: TRAP transporter substrate-binding protein [Deltaproteobacteria bacterium]|nr:TRAP transporter substrate-binding protein [Deltaproteobacteria bacterium]
MNAARPAVARALLLLLGCLLLASHASGQNVRLKIQSAWSRNMPVLGETIRNFESRMNAMEGHGIRLRVYDANKLVPTLQIMDAVSSGKVDAGFAFPGYWMGKLPAAAVFGAVPFGPEAPEYLAWLHEGGGLELWEEIYAKLGVVPIPCGVIPPEASGWFREPINSPADLRGLKIRYAGLGGKTLEKLGASITMLAAGDIFLSLERGVLDATEYSMPAVDKPLGFYKVAKHYYFPGWHQPSSIMELVVNAKSWAKLSEPQQAAVRTACDASTLWSMTRGLAIQGEALAFFEQEGVTIHSWSPEMMAQFRSAAGEVMQEASAADPDFKRAWDSLQAFRAKYRHWASIATPED